MKNCRVYKWARLWTQKLRKAPTQSEEGGGSQGHQQCLCLLWLWGAEGLPSWGEALRLAKTTEVIGMEGQGDVPCCHQPTFPSVPLSCPRPFQWTHTYTFLITYRMRFLEPVLFLEAADRKRMTLGTWPAATGLLLATQKDKGMWLGVWGHPVLHCKL